jgi:hypothetical protein
LNKESPAAGEPTGPEAIREEEKKAGTSPAPPIIARGNLGVRSRNRDLGEQKNPLMEFQRGEAAIDMKKTGLRRLAIW